MFLTTRRDIDLSPNTTTTSISPGAYLIDALVVHEVFLDYITSFFLLFDEVAHPILFVKVAFSSQLLEKIK